MMEEKGYGNQKLLDDIKRENLVKEREMTFRSTIPYPMTKEEWRTMEINDMRIPEYTYMQETMDPFYKYFRTISVAHVVPEVTMIKGMRVDCTVREAIEVFSREEVVDILMLDPDKEEPMTGVWTYSDIVLSLLLANGSKLDGGIFTWSLKELRDKVIRDKRKFLKDDYNPENYDTIRRSSSGINTPPHNPSSFGEAPHRFRNFLDIPQNRPRAASDSSSMSRPTFGGGDVLPLDRQLEYEHRQRVNFDSEEVEGECVSRSDSSGTLESGKKYLSRGTISNVICLRLDGTLWQAMLVMNKFMLHRLVVVTEKVQPVYMITGERILSALANDCKLREENSPFMEDLERLDIGKFEKKVVKVCTLEHSMLQVLSRMQESGNMFLPVVNNEKDRIVIDLVTKADLLNLIQELFDPRKQNYTDQVLQLENVNLKFLFSLRKKRFMKKEKDLENGRIARGAKLFHTDLDDKRPVYKDLDLKSASEGGKTVFRPNLDNWSVTVSSTFGEVVMKMTDKKVMRLVVLEERTGRLLGTICPSDIFEFLIRHFKEDFVLRKFSLSQIPILKDERRRRD